MTNLIPIDAAHEEAFMDAVWTALKADATDLGKQQRILTALRAIPAINPAAIREAALREAAYVAINACLVPPDGGSPTEAERLVCEEAHRRILALIGEKK